MIKPSIFSRFFIPIIIIALSVIIFVVFLKSKPAALQKPIEEKVWLVESQKIKITDHQPVLSLIGQVSSTEDIEITSAVEADVLKRWVNVGDQVTKGQKLLSLDQTNYKIIHAQRIAEENEIKAQIQEEVTRFQIDKLLLEKEKALLNIANNAVDRAQTLEKSSMASSSQLDDAKRAAISQQIAITQRQAAIENHPVRLDQLKAKLASASSRLALAAEDLRHTEITAPINGIVTKIDLNQAEHVRNGSSLLTMYNHKQLEIKAFVPETYLSPITKSLTDKQILKGFVTNQEVTYPINLVRMSGEIQKNTAGSYLYFSIGDEEHPFISGQTLALKLIMPGISQTVALPSNAIYGTNHVFSIINERLKRTAISWLGETVSESGDVLFLIRSAELKNGDIVLTSKFANAIDGLKVTTSIAE